MSDAMAKTTGRLRRAMLARTLNATLALAAAATALANGPAEAHSAMAHTGSLAADPPGPVSWLAAGDSYSSGEGIPGSGMTPADDCAQSARAYGPRAADILRKTRSWKVTPLAFTACTGAVVSDFYQRPNKSHPPQDQWSRDAGDGSGRFDVVTMSFGGNDVEFANILKKCVLPNDWGNTLTLDWTDGCQVNEDELNSRVAKLVAGVSVAVPDTPYLPGTSKANLADFYDAVARDHLTAGGVLVVVGYPRLFAPSDQWGMWRHGVCSFVSAADADLLGRVAVKLDDALEAAVKKARSTLSEGRRIRYVSRLDEFDNNGKSHSLCASDTSWMNGLAMVTRNGEVRVEHAFHPNEVGHQVTAKAVAGQVYETLTETQAPEQTQPPALDPTEPSEPESTPAPIEDGTQEFGIGDEFEAFCSVAWPTAPTYTSDSIVMTMSCPDVPQQYLFVNVTYPDPNLPINPSTGMVRVHGEIVDAASSAYGYKTLIVIADDVDLDP